MCLTSPKEVAPKSKANTDSSQPLPRWKGGQKPKAHKISETLLIPAGCNSHDEHENRV